MQHPLTDPDPDNRYILTPCPIHDWHNMRVRNPLFLYRARRWEAFYNISVCNGPLPLWRPRDGIVLFALFIVFRRL